MKPNKRRYKLESVSITASYNKAGEECYIVTEWWTPLNQWGRIPDCEYKYSTKTLESAMEIAQIRINKFNNS